MVRRPAIDVECLDLAVLIFRGFLDGRGVLRGNRRLRRGHSLTKSGDRLDGGICAGERRVEKRVGGGEEASGAAEGGHCDRGSE